MQDSAPTGPIDVLRSLDEGGWNTFQKSVLVFAAMALAMDGIANQSLGLAVPSLVKAWNVARSDFASVSALNLVGVALGTLMGGLIGDRFGRRVGMIVSLALFGVMTAAGAFATSPGELAGMRFLDGLGIGGAIPNGAAMITEFTPIRRRSVAIAFSMAFIPVGGLLAGLLGATVLPDYGWQALFMICGAATLVLAVVFIFVLPESPGYLLRQPHRKHELIRLLGRFGYGFSSDAEFAQEARAGHTRMTALFDKHIRLDTLALWVGFFFCLMASYSLFSWVPTLLSTKGMDARASSLGVTAFHLGGVIGGLVAGWVMQQLGSRGATIVFTGGGVAAAVGLALLLSGGAVPSVAGLVLIAEGFFIAGVHTAVYTLAATAYPPFVRATGVGTASAFGRLGAILSSYTGISTIEGGGGFTFFLVVGCMLGLSGLALVFMRKQLPKAA
ncbi:MAG: MFS transporter [Caulobacteraceae bacterium]